MNLVIASFPFSVVERLRRTHDLEYRNNREYDYAFSDFPVVPYCMQRWASEGLRLDDEFVGRLWMDHANRREGLPAVMGEFARARKLVLDAFRGVYDMASVAEFAEVQVKYSSDEDMDGRDLLLMAPSGPRWVQFTVSASGTDYMQLKQARRVRRNAVDRDVTVLRAGPYQIDRSHQPYVPTIDWYSSVMTQLNEDWYRPSVKQLISAQPSFFDE
jgi:hypothetical protein